MTHRMRLQGARGVLGAGALVVLTFTLCGCPNPNTYGTARTTPKGKISHSIAAEGFAFTSDTADVAVPLAPTYALRWGVADSVDLGFRIQNFSSLGADAKINLVKGGVDLALDPGLQYYSYSVTLTDSSGDEASDSTSVFYLHAPLIFDANLSEAVSLVLTPGFVFAAVTSDIDLTGSDSDLDVVSTTEGAIARFTVGFDFRASKKFALHPEVTLMRAFEAEANFFIFGLGFNFGHLPDFSDLAEAE